MDSSAFPEMPDVELVATQWRMFNTAFDVYAGTCLLAVIAQGTDGMWSVWHPGGKYVAGHLPVIEAAAQRATSVTSDCVMIRGIDS